MSLPNYILRRFVASRGIRLPKMKTNKGEEVAGTCATCSKAVVWRETGVPGGKRLDGRWSRGEYYHWSCATPEESDDYRCWQNGWISRHERQETAVAKGNLEQEEYRYWVGTDAAPDIESKWAMCRCCRTSTYSKDQRIAHFRDPDFLCNGNQCSHRLIQAYEKLKSSTLCLVCKQPRNGNLKWGIPLCDNPSCEKSWKFGQERWLPLYIELNKQEKAPVEATKVAKVVKAFIDCGGDKPTTRPYCEDCRMFTDNAAHYEEHRLKIMRGEICAD